jgi:hypothetical protein
MEQGSVESNDLYRISVRLRRSYEGSRNTVYSMKKQRPWGVLKIPAALTTIMEKFPWQCSSCCTLNLLP